MFRNQFNAPLDANAVLGSQILAGTDGIDWTEVFYVGSALTDAEIVLAMITDDWAELGLIYMTDNFLSWTLGQHQWNRTEDVLAIGCNNDRMAHVPKG